MHRIGFTHTLCILHTYIRTYSHIYTCASINSVEHRDGTQKYRLKLSQPVGVGRTEHDDQIICPLCFAVLCVRSCDWPHLRLQGGKL